MRRKYWMRLMRRALIMLLVTSLVGGCAFQSAAPTQMYRLSITPDPALTSASTRSPLAETIELMPLRSNRPQSGSLGILVAQVGEVVRVDEFAAGRWEEAPETAIDWALRSQYGLSASGGATGRTPATGRSRLYWSLDAFEMVEPLTGDPPYVAVSIRFELRTPATPEAMQTGIIHEREYLPAQAPLQTVVLAFDRATSRAIARLMSIPAAVPSGAQKRGAR
ncbi:hypothetical protein CKO36_14740 [Rhabdochromatium marinum]|nr:hypothetical protein [Rhabdochromatium marinum]